MNQQRDLLLPLKNALQAAGAFPLTSAQEQQIKILIADFRAAHPPTPPSSDVQAARLAYDNAILAMNAAAAGAAVKTIVDDQAGQTSSRMQAEAAFAISVVQVLQGDQPSLLQERMGSEGVVRLLVSLVGGTVGPVGPGRGPGGMGGGGYVKK